MADWGDGAYEAFSPHLTAAAARLVELAAPGPGERAVDLGCGDGNVTLALAASGAEVTAVDPSARLLGLAARRAAEAGHAVRAVQGAAEALPLPDGSADLVLSNFGVIFTPDPRGAVREVLRVLAPGGRFVYSAWTGDGPLAQIGALLGRALAPPGEEPAGEVVMPAWDAPETFLTALVPGGGTAVGVHRESLDFVAPSAAHFVGEQAELHPMYRDVRRRLGDERRWRALLAEATALLERASAEPDRMVVPAPYVVVQVRPRG